MEYICPICSASLSKQTSNKQVSSWHCPTGHQFDCAKEGYVNLLPVQKKNSKDPGDNKEMMQARREFLNQGHYQLLSDAVNQIAITHAAHCRQIVDIGCGEGYYSHRLFEALRSQQEDKQCQLQGVDISKTAIRYAAKRYAQMDFCVASAYEMPFKDASADLAIRIYAPSKAEELARVVAIDGLLITVSPGPMHHFALKQLIYAEPKLHSSDVGEINGFTLIDTQRVEAKMVLSKPLDIEHFLNMTPYAWKLTKEQKATLGKDGLSCELDFHIGIYRRNGST
jgi:23S rRNA (guanine745-N1)-methyltransferase